MSTVVEPDHLVLAARDLDAGAAWLESLLGVKLAQGGKHARMGTHNRLLVLGDNFYLELIAIDPDAVAPGRPLVRARSGGLAGRSPAPDPQGGAQQ